MIGVRRRNTKCHILTARSDATPSHQNSDAKDSAGRGLYLSPSHDSHKTSTGTPPLTFDKLQGMNALELYLTHLVPQVQLSTTLLPAKSAFF